MFICDDLDGWDEGGELGQRLEREEYIYNTADSFLEYGRNYFQQCKVASYPPIKNKNKTKKENKSLKCHLF